MVLLQRGEDMKVEVNYTKEVTCCKECPYYFQEHDMGATIPICTKSKEITILSSPNIIPNDCPIDAIKVNSYDETSKFKECKCKCIDLDETACDELLDGIRRELEQNRPSDFKIHNIKRMIEDFYH